MFNLYWRNNRYSRIRELGNFFIAAVTEFEKCMDGKN